MDRLDAREQQWRRVRMAPMARAFGLKHQTRGDALTFWQNPHPQLLDSTGAIDAAVLPALIDHGCSAAALRSLASYSPAATLDLRIDWLSPPTPGAGLAILPSVIATADATVLVEGRILDGPTNRLVAYGLVTMALGRLPGGMDAPADAEIPDIGDLRTEGLGSFEDFLALRTGDAGAAFDPLPRHVGSVLVPSVHGGIVSALLFRMANSLAPGARPINLHVSFLRATMADAPLTLSGAVVKAGRSVTMIGTEIRQGAVTASALVKLGG